MLVGGQPADAPSFAVGCSAVTILGALYDVLAAGVTVMAEYKEARVARVGQMGREAEPAGKCLSNANMAIARASESENTSATEPTKL